MELEAHHPLALCDRLLAAWHSVEICSVAVCREGRIQQNALEFTNFIIHSLVKQLCFHRQSHLAACNRPLITCVLGSPPR